MSRMTSVLLIEQLTMFQQQQHENGQIKHLWTTLRKGPLDHDQRSFGMISHFIILQKCSILIHSLHFLLRLMRLAEVDQVQSTVIDIPTFKNCKNINMFNETTLTLAIKMG